MRDKIRKIVKTCLEHWNIGKEEWDIDFAYDYISIEIKKTGSCISLILLNEIEEKLNSELSWVNVINGKLCIGYDISNIIIEEFSTFEIYDHYYSMWEEFMTIIIVCGKNK